MHVFKTKNNYNLLYKNKKMQIKLFTIPIQAVAEQNNDLNHFLSSNKIIDIEKQLVQNTNGTFWCFYINYEPKNSEKEKYDAPIRIDYRNVLSVEEFKTFDKLRSIRKQLAKEDAVSAFVVATDAELAEIARLSEINLSNLKKIKGFGEQKIEKYGKKIIAELKQKNDLIQK